MTLRYFDVFGAKVFTGRKAFRDDALESRIIDIPCTEATDFERFPPALSETDIRELDDLRNELYGLRLHYGAAPRIRELPAGLPSGRIRQKIAALMGALPPELDDVVKLAVKRILESEKDRYAQTDEGEAWAELKEMEDAGQNITANRLKAALGLNSERAAAEMLKRLGFVKAERKTETGEFGARKVQTWKAPQKVKDKAYAKLGYAGETPDPKNPAWTGRTR